MKATTPAWLPDQCSFHPRQIFESMQMSLEQKKKLLVSVIGTIFAIHKSEVEALKAPYADIGRPDFVWHYLLQSFATMGRAAGWKGLIGNESNYNRVTFAALTELPDAQRALVVEETCRSAKVRMPSIKAKFILRCFGQVTALGGPHAAKTALFSAPGRSGKIKFLTQFHGIGPKYARNMMMDVHHEDFRESIAIDSRIKAISEALGLTFRNYDDHEEFYLDAAHASGMSGWELDRLMFNFQKEVLSAINEGSFATAFPMKRLAP